MYFKNFPLRHFNLDGKKYLLPNIFRRIRFNVESKTSAEAFVEYIVGDYEKPVKIAAKLYGSRDYEWVLFLFNDIYDIYEQWPMDHLAFEEYVTAKYGISNLHTLHHYETKEGEIVDSTHPSYDRVTITNYDYEEKLNDSKRKLRILKPEYLPKVIEEFRKLLDV